MSMSVPADLSCADDEGFAQPEHGLFAKLDAGLGCVNLPDDFAQAPSANQLSVIADWQRSLDAHRRRALRPRPATSPVLFGAALVRRARTGRCRGAACRS